ncbi:MAG: CTB family bacteriocin [Cyanobacteria bacterium J06621_15]
MTNTNKEINLFSNLTEEQQEIIAGGNSVLPINNDVQKLGQLGNQGGLGKSNSPFSSTDFLAEVNNINTISSSGPNGSTTGGSANVQVVKTSGLNSFGGFN